MIKKKSKENTPKNLQKKDAGPVISLEKRKEYLSERDFFDDHGPAIIGNRLHKPKI